MERSAPDRSGIPWLVAGSLLSGLLFMLLLHFRRDVNPAQELALKASRVDLVGRMQLSLASASEAEKSAVLATTDEESLGFADQARAATLEVDHERQELGELLATGGTANERDLLGQFAEAFGNFRRIDEEVLGLAVKNTNLKAYSLAFGPAAEAVAQMDGALARVAAKRAGTPDGERAKSLVFDTRLAVLRIQALLPPHIAEESDAKMDQLEASMSQEELKVRQALAGLGQVLKADPDLEEAVAGFARYGELKARILVLSRENTNVRSLAISLNQKRKAMVVCLDALNALRLAILDEPIAGVTYGRPTRPR